MLYPLVFHPVFMEKIWGGNKIASHFGFDYSPLINCGELWALSGVEGNESVVKNGFLKGNNLNELVEIYMGDLTGDKVFEKSGNVFPVLIKLLNAEDYLSVQVHPGDKLAMARHASPGKSEMWYVIGADPGAEILYGFSRNTNRDEFMNYLQDKKIMEIINKVQPQAGDAFYIPAGTIHAIGPGLLLAEIQQTSDITYRVYDWDRIGADGLPRELHTRMALDALNYDATVVNPRHPAVTDERPVPVVSSPHFTVNLMQISRETHTDFNDLDSFVACLILEGSLNIIHNSETIRVNAGETVLLPASIKEFVFMPEGVCKFLEVYIP